MESVIRAFAAVHAWVFETWVEPVVHWAGFATHMERAFDATEYVLLGVLEVAFIATVLVALERWRPVESIADKRAVRVDVLYTLLHRLGAAPLLLFALLTVPLDAFDGWLRLHDMVPWKLEDALPWLNTHPLASFVVYLVIIDFFAYWLHRAQHRFEWWWALHALHHSQRQMTVWSDDRNHLLDDFLNDAAFALIALLIGVAPGQFVLLVMVSRLVESLSHANLRLSFGAMGEKLLVSPRFHRLHHAIGLGHEGRYRGVNFAVLFPLWDVLFRTADFSRDYPPTGIRDQQEGREYGQGFWQQQALGLKRMVGAVLGKAA
jgi:sterol desaturase/sphingolipid hydroxylase (fatty acid hydroxylase superfamily)